MAKKRLSSTSYKSLLDINPAVAKEWHPIKNNSLTPMDVKALSNKKVWWICSKGHEWNAAVSNRSNGRGCPYCSNRIAFEDNCLQSINPRLAKEWHPTKNGSLTPKDITPGSNKKVWWICSKGHEWNAAVSNRSNGRGCPYCSNKAVFEDNCLQTIDPILSKEWHPNKNNPLTAKDVTASSGKKVWWLCSKGHEWEAIVANRSKGSGCPYCNSQTSQLELRIYTEIKYFFEGVHHRKKICGVECDIYVQSINVGIEVDGLYWHKNKYFIDRGKTNFLKKKNIILIRVREKGLKRISESDIFFSRNDDEFIILRKTLDSIIKITNMQGDIKNKIEEYKQTGKMANDEEYLNLLYMLPSPLPGNSLQDCNINLSKEWHPTKNAFLTPKDVSAGSGKKVWWVCSKGHEWKASVLNRSKGKGCPYCSGRAASIDKCLQNLNQTLAEEWHPTKNGSLTPNNVSPGSVRKVWWICSKGHVWAARIADRSNGNGCPHCAGKAISEDNCLQTVNPILSREWHPTKNESLTPKNVTPGSGKKVWWICSKGHEWKATVYHRSKGRGCPYCSNEAVCKGNCLQTANPILAEEWHPTKNGSLTPTDVLPGSDKKVWWICSKGHEWHATILSRNKGSGCPYCSNKATCEDNCLMTANPILSKEWNSTKNGSLTPKDVTPGSNKKVWWICSKGHEWETKVSHRSKGSRCPYCSRKA